jgi:hypothetical protein
MRGRSLGDRQCGTGAELGGEKGVIGAPTRDQLLMFAGFNGPSALDDPDPVGADDGL